MTRFKLFTMVLWNASSASISCLMVNTRLSVATMKVKSLNLVIQKSAVFVAKATEAIANVDLKLKVISRKVLEERKPLVTRSPMTRNVLRANVMEAVHLGIISSMIDVNL